MNESHIFIVLLTGHANKTKMPHNPLMPVAFSVLAPHTFCFVQSYKLPIMCTTTVVHMQMYFFYFFIVTLLQQMP